MNVPVHGDTTKENNETFFLKLSSPSGALLADNSATGTIRNDDATPGPAVKPSLYVSNATILEPDAGSANESFTVSLSAPSASTVTVNYATQNSSAVAPGDYTSVSTTPLTFAPGDVTKTVDVPVQGDTVHG